MDVAGEIRRIADEIRAITTVGLRWSAEKPYDADRYQRLRQAAAQLFALVDTRDAVEVEQSLFRELTHIAPLPVGDGAVFDDDGRILLIRRADDGLWAMPGGAFEMGEAPAEGVAREVVEEAGVVVEVQDLIGVYDSRYCETNSSLQLYMFVFLCRPVARRAATTPHEVLDVGWFTESDLPPLSPGHTVRVPDAFAFLRDRRTRFEPPGRGSSQPSAPRMRTPKDHL